MAITNQQILQRLQTSKDRMEMAVILTELAERAEKNPMMQDFLRKVRLRPPFDRFEYRKPGNRKGFWARKPYWREHPTVPQLQAKLELSETANSLYGERGTVERPDGTRIARVPHLVGEQMRGKKFASEEEQAERKRQKTIERIAQAVATFRIIYNS